MRQASWFLRDNAARIYGIDVAALPSRLAA